MEYKTSRKEWEQAYIEGISLLGFKYNNRTEPFQGASGATHPVLAEAVTQFQAGAYKELLPAEGPVRTQIVGRPVVNRTLLAILLAIGLGIPSSFLFGFDCLLLLLVSIVLSLLFLNPVVFILARLFPMILTLA